MISKFINGINGGISINSFLDKVEINALDGMGGMVVVTCTAEKAGEMAEYLLKLRRECLEKRKFVMEEL